MIDAYSFGSLGVVCYEFEWCSVYVGLLYFDYYLVASSFIMLAVVQCSAVQCSAIRVVHGILSIYCWFSCKSYAIDYSV